MRKNNVWKNIDMNIDVYTNIICKYWCKIRCECKYKYKYRDECKYICKYKYEPKSKIYADFYVKVDMNAWSYWEFESEEQSAKIEEKSSISAKQKIIMIMLIN